jgi:hypothetical protein
MKCPNETPCKTILIKEKYYISFFFIKIENKKATGSVWTGVEIRKGVRE